MSKQSIHAAILTIVLPLVMTMPAATHAQVNNLLQNPSFEEDEVILADPAWEQWVTWGDQDGLNSTIEIDETEFIDGARSLKVEPRGSTNWYFIVLYLPIPLDVGTDYTVSFWAKAEAPRPLTAQMKATDNSVTWGTTTFDLTTEWTEYTLTAQAMNATAKLEILCAGTEISFWLDFVYVYEGAYVAGIEPAGASPPVKSTAPAPDAAATDVPRDVILGWQPGQFARTHDVYFGTDFDDVNNASRANPVNVLVKQNQDANTYDPPGRLEFGQTHYWRVDEVNAPPDSTVHKGDVWSFTVEPFAYPVENVVATACCTGAADKGPENTVNGSGLDNGRHSTEETDMWLAAPAVGEPVWIRFDFDRIYKLYQARLWNYNMIYEGFLGFGLRDVTLEYTADGDTWTALGDFQLAQGPGIGTYAGQTLDLGGIAARAVRLNVTSNYGGDQYGLSEVQFSYIPAHPREPQPASGTTGTGLDLILSWRAGREAALHDVSFGTGPQAVAEGTAPVETTSEATYAVGSLELGTTYYWKVNEVNVAEAISTWAGDVWNFTTQQYLVVDDFESYTDDVEAGQAVFQTWLDGYNINDNGSIVGNDNPPYAVPVSIHGGAQALPVSYDNSGTATSSVAERTFGGPQNWTQGTAAILTLYFYGDPDNNADEPMWVRLTDQSSRSGTVTYGAGAAEATDNQTIAAWHEWSIPLADFGVDLTSVTAMAIGFGGTGPRSAGVMLFDDIRLYPARPAGTPMLAAHWALDGDAADSSGNGNNGIVNGAATWVAAGVLGGALSLNGTDAYVDGGDGASLDITEAITLSAWVNTADANNGEHNPFVAKGDQAYAIKHNTSNEIETFVYDDGWHTATYAIDSSFNGEWHYVASTYDGQNLRLYVDGVLRATTGYAGSIASTTYNVNIGRNTQNTDRFYNGLIDEVRIYDGALPPEEIVQLATP